MKSLKNPPIGHRAVHPKPHNPLSLKAIPKYVLGLSLGASLMGLPLHASAQQCSGQVVADTFNLDNSNFTGDRSSLAECNRSML